MNVNQQLNMDNQKSSTINRNYKDSLFRLIFQNKKDLLELYNAINESDYTDENDLTIYTLDDAIYISYKNDMSFLLSDILNLYEHQSTINPNMPIRGFLYFARNYESYIELNHLDIYSSVLQPLPLPQYIIFYNGTKDMPEKQILELTDAFPKIKGKEPCLNCKATLLNINYGHNEAIMKRCHKLRDYATFIHYIRENTRNYLPLDMAIDKAIDDCIFQHVLEDFLVKHRAEVKSMVLSSFDQENHDRILKEAYEKKGEQQGEKKLLKKQVIKKLEKGLAVREIAEMLEEDEDTILQILKDIQAGAED